MHALTRWFIYNPVAANLLMLLILIGGIFSAVSMRIEGFPRLPADSLVISTHMAGANSTQIDRQISQKIKTGLQGLPGVQQIESLSFEAYSSVS